MKKFIILIPPSEGKNEGGSNNPLKKAPKHVAEILKKLNNYKGSLEQLLGVKGSALKKAIDANNTILTSPTCPAIERYSGVVFNGIDYKNLSHKGKKYFNEHVRIISALFGLIKPLDLIPNYKLKIEKLNADKFWKPILTDQIKNYFIIDLLPQSHAKAISYTEGLRIDFIVSKNGQRKPAGHAGKLIKGKFIKWLAENEINNISDFKKFKEDGFSFSENNFIKTLP